MLGLALAAQVRTAIVLPAPGSAVTSPIPPMRERCSRRACTWRMPSVWKADEAGTSLVKGLEAML